MFTKRLLSVVIAWLLFVVIALWVVQPVAAWVSSTKSWEAYGGNGVRVTVIDTTGVCLYVASGSVWGGQYAITEGKSVAITAVPKTQMPLGAGCQ